MTLTFHQPDLMDCAELATIMRRPDRLELEATSGRNPYEVLVEGLELSSECYVAKKNGIPMAMWGVVDNDGIGVAWLLTSWMVELYPLLFWRACKAALSGLTDRWPILLNAIDCRHSQALRWGRRLGFQFDEPELMGPQELPFAVFRITKETLNV